jgi:hypothetical protein
MSDDPAWPVEIAGVIESVTTTPTPDDEWAVAALGLHADGDAVRARTWGRTRTRHGFEREGRGYVQFVRDPLTFVDAALGRVTVEEPVLPDAAAWAQIEAEQVDSGTEGGTDWVDWRLTPVASAVREQRVPVTDRGYAAVVEMTVAASRLGVAGYEDAELRDRLDYFASVVDRCGGPPERRALDRLDSHIAWRRPAESTAGGGENE